MSFADHSYYYKHVNGIYLGVIIYVDDMLIASNSDSLVHDFKKYLGIHFLFKDLGFPTYFLGLEIARSSTGLSICQRKYILDLLTDAGLTGCKPLSTPMDSNSHIQQEGSSVLQNAKSYRRLIGRLLYLCITCPDISYSVNCLSQFLSSLHEHHMQAAQRILKYLKGTICTGLFYSSSSSLDLSIFADADYGSCQDTRRSVSVFLVIAYSWDLLLFLGAPRNSTLSLDQ